MDYACDDSGMDSVHDDDELGSAQDVDNNGDAHGSEQDKFYGGAFRDDNLYAHFFLGTC